MPVGRAELPCRRAEGEQIPQKRRQEAGAPEHRPSRDLRDAVTAAPPQNDKRTQKKGAAGGRRPRPEPARTRQEEDGGDGEGAEAESIEPPRGRFHGKTSCWVVDRE